mgnify:CR=1 FL=1
MACCMQNFPKNVGGVQVTNDGDPVPPGTKGTCCLCIPLFTYSGIPEGTTRVPEAEEKEREEGKRSREEVEEQRLLVDA